MTSSEQDREIENAVELLGALARILNDPTAGQKLKKLSERIQERITRPEEVSPVESRKWPEKGTCPTCGKAYTISRKNGSLRRHGEGKCNTDFQLPRELVPAVRAIALDQWTQVAFTGDPAEFGVSDGRTQDNNGD